MPASAILQNEKWTAPTAPVSWGELFDKISILDIKLARLSDPAALRNVRHEHSALSRVADGMATHREIVDLLPKLRAVNEMLWDVEDRLREMEAAEVFDEAFVALARSVYKHNDERARIKRDINDRLRSEFVEEKSYCSRAR